MTPESLLREGLSGWGLAADAAPRLLNFPTGCWRKTA